MRRPTALTFCLLASAASAQPAEPLPEGATLRIGSHRFRMDDGGVGNADLSADGKHLVVVSNYGELIKFDTSTGLPAYRTPGALLHSEVRCLPGGRVLFTGEDFIGIWDPIEGNVTRFPIGDFRLKDGDLMDSDRMLVAVSDDGRRLALAGRDGGQAERKLQALIIDLTTGKRIRAIEAMHDDELNVKLSPDGRTLITWGLHRGVGRRGLPERLFAVQVWDVATGKEQFRIDVGREMCRGLAVSPDGARLAIHRAYGGPNLWDLITGKPLGRFAGRAQLTGRFAFSPDHKRLACICEDGAVQVWDLNKPGPVRVIPGLEVRVPELRWLADGRLLAWGCWGSGVRVWDALSGEELAPNPGPSSGVWKMAFSPDGETLRCGVGHRQLRRWDVRTGRHRGDWVAPQDDQRRNGPIVGLDPAWRFVVLGDPGLRFYDIESGLEVYSFGDTRPSSFAFSADGRWFAPAPERMAGEVEVWDTETGRSIPIPERPGRYVRTALSADGSRLATATDPSPSTQDPRPLIRLWDVPGREMLAEIPHLHRTTKEMRGLALSGDGSRLVAVDQRLGLTVWSFGTERPPWSFGVEGLSYDAGPVLSPDGRTVAVSVRTRKDRPGERAEYGESVVQIWEVTSGLLRHEFRGHRGEVRSLAYRPDGGTLASGSADTTILFWDVYLARGAVADAWERLAGPKATDAAGAMGCLLANPADAVGILGDRLKPAEGTAPELIRGWIADLDGDTFKRRESASARLMGLGRAAEAPLWEALAADRLGAEGRRRAEVVIRKVKRHEPTAEELRKLRAVEVLERLARDSEEAKGLLAKLARGQAGMVLTREADAALGRLNPGD